MGPSSYTFTNLIIDQADLELRLAVGEVSGALDRIDELEAVFRRAGMHRFRLAVDWQDRLQLRGWLLQALGGSTASPLASRIGKACRRMARSSDPLTRGDALLSEAAMASLRGDGERARRLWREALEGFRETGLGAHAAATRVRLAAVASRYEARRLLALVDEYFRREDIEQRVRFVDTFAPAVEGFGSELL